MTRAKACAPQSDRARAIHPRARALALANVGHLQQRVGLEARADAILVSGPNGRISSVNPKARALLGPRARRREPIASMFVAADRARVAGLSSAGGYREAVLTVLGVGPVFARVVTLEDGRTAWTLAPTTAMAVEDHLRHTEELLDSERRRSAALEEEVRQMKRVLAMIAHDLKGPLTAVLGWTDLLQRQPLDLVGRSRAVEVIARNARAQAALVDELLDVARVLEGKLRVDMSICDLAEIAAAAVESAAPAAADAGLTLRYEGPHAGARVMADPYRVDQILANLLSNAIKFTPRGGRVTVAVGRAGDRVRMDIVDTGRGIDRALLPYVFDWLYQGEARPNDALRGLGLGLYIVKRLVELQKGSVNVLSGGVGRGTAFSVFLPARDVDDRAWGVRRTPLASSVGAGRGPDGPVRTSS